NSEKEKQVSRLAAEEVRRPFDLSEGPLLRVKLVRVSEQEHVVLMSMHHIVSDGWSMGVLVREVAALYEAFSQGEPSPLEDVAIQYADFAAWQRQWLSGEVLDEQMGYWRQQLAGAPAVLELPTDRPRPAVSSYRGATEAVAISAEVTQAAKAVCRQQGVTLFM